MASRCKSAFRGQARAACLARAYRDRTGKDSRSALRRFEAWVYRKRDAWRPRCESSKMRKTSCAGVAMDMSRYLITRIVAVSVAILLAALALALWRAQYDVQREERGAAEMVRLFEHLYALENGPPADIPAHLDALRRINEAGHLRHVQLAVRDDSGALRVAPRDIAPSTWLESVFARVAPGIGVAQADPSGPWTLAARRWQPLRRHLVVESRQRTAGGARQPRRHAGRAGPLRHRAAARGVLGAAPRARAAASDA